jgi:uncharacterized protein
MISDDFEWDDDKAAENGAKHGIAFHDAKFVFDDPMSFTREDAAAYGERRLIIVGLVELKLIAVVYAERGDRVRLISARKASGHEKPQYYAD